MAVRWTGDNLEEVQTATAVEVPIGNGRLTVLEFRAGFAAGTQDLYANVGSLDTPSFVLVPVGAWIVIGDHLTVEP